MAGRVSSRRRVASADVDPLDGLTKAVVKFGRVLDELTPRVDEFGLTAQRLRVLQVLARGPSCPRDLSADLGVHVSGITRLCDALVDADLITRERGGQTIRPGETVD